MFEAWRMIKEFPDYSVSTYGRVSSGHYGRLLTPSSARYDIPTVGLVRDGVQYRKAVPLLVANAWLPQPELDIFDTPIHLDGDRRNCRADNLMWRPRWFAIAFHKERRTDIFPKWKASFEIVETGEIFEHPRVCAMRYGVLEMDIGLALSNEENRVFPQWFHYKWL